MTMQSHRTLSRRASVPFSSPIPKTRAEFERRKRQVAHSDASSVVEWLNAAKGTPAYRRVLNVRRELENIGNALADLRLRLVEAVRALRRGPQKMDEVNRLRERFRKRHNALNKMLSRYVFVPALAYSVETGLWRFNTIPRRTNSQVVKLNDQIGVIRVSETSVIAALARLAVNRELYKVRLCENCGQRWVFARRKIDKFCRGDCRVSFHVRSEEGKRNHRKAQAEYLNRLRERAKSE